MDRSSLFAVIAIVLGLLIAISGNAIFHRSSASGLASISNCKAAAAHAPPVIGVNLPRHPCVRVATDFEAIALECAPLVASRTARALVSLESGFQPLSIHVNGGALAHQPATLTEAVATARSLWSRGWDFDMGLAQINIRTAQRLGVTIEQAFDPCANLRAMQRVLQECLVLSQRGGHDARAGLLGALSCFNTGDASSGLRNGYVARVIAAAGDGHGDR